MKKYDTACYATVCEKSNLVSRRENLLLVLVGNRLGRFTLGGLLDGILVPLGHTDKPVEEDGGGNVEDDVGEHDAKVSPGVAGVDGHAL